MINQTALAIAIQAGIPVYIEGNPGAGKTCFIKAVGQALGYHVEIVTGNNREPQDFSGLPVVAHVNGLPQVTFAPPDWALRLIAAKKGLLVLDELSTAPPACQAVMLRLINERVAGSVTLPEEVVTIGIYNPPDVANGWDFSAALANRGIHMKWKPNFDDWANGMLGGFPLPKLETLPVGWERFIPQARALVVGFCRARRTEWYHMPDNESAAGKAWPSPRSWEAFAARSWAACEAIKADNETRADLICGSVGEGAGLEFLGWIRDLDLPDPKKLLADPDSYRHPSRADQAFAVLASVVAEALGGLTKEYWMNAWKILAKAASAEGADVAAHACKQLAEARKNRQDLPVPLEQVKAFMPLLRAAGLS